MGSQQFGFSTSDGRYKPKKLRTETGFGSLLWLNGGDSFGRWRYRAAKNVFHDPHAAQDRGSVRAVGGDFQHACLREHAATMAASGHFDAAHFFIAFDVVQAVELGEALVDGDEVRVNKVGDAQVVF